MYRKLIIQLILVSYILVNAAVWNIDDLADFQNALSVSESNNEDDILYLAEGFYTFIVDSETLSFVALPTENYSLSIIGSETEDTILDGEELLQIITLNFQACSFAEVTVSNIHFVDGKGEININDSDPEHNGGGLHIDGGNNISITIENCMFDNCSAPWGGGASVFIGDASSCEINSCNFSNNSATYSIDDYAAGGDGGGLYCGVGESSTLQILSCTFENNQTLIGEQNADDAGGLMIYSESPNSTVNLIGNNFTGNNGADGGGAMLYFLAANAICTIHDNVFQENTARDNGGGLWLRATQGIELIHSQNSYIDNQCNFYGGGEYWEIEVAADVESYENEYRNNTADGPGDDSQGGAIFVECPTDSIEIHHNFYQNNFSDAHGGAISLNCGNFANIHHNVSANNDCLGIGGFLNLSIALSDGTAQIYNNTCYLNSADQGSSVFCDAWETDYTIQIANNIFWGGSSFAIDYATWNPTFNPSDIEVTYCDINDASADGIVYGLGCINEDPLFVDEVDGDFHITWQNFPIEDATKSPCIDAGDPTYAFDSDGTSSDIGAFYFDQISSIDSPGTIVISIEDDMINLSWQSVEYAQYYRVYSSNNPFFGFEVDNTGIFSSTMWQTSINNAKRFYRVTACRE